MALASQLTPSRCYVASARKSFAVKGRATRAGKIAQRRPVRTFSGKVEPVCEESTAFSPATVANLGPGFDFLGCAVEGQGDLVTARLRPDLPGKVVIKSIEGDGGRLSLTAEENCCGIGAIETLKLLGVTDMGIELECFKGLPLGSGMGSSAASAGAACWATNALFGCPLSQADLVPAGLVSEAFVSGYHADNIAPAIMGGFVMVRTYDPELQLEALKFGSAASEEKDLYFALVTPEFEAPTREMRAALPTDVPLKNMILNSTAGGSLVAGILLGDSQMLGEALNSDTIIEPARGPLIPGFGAVKEAALAAGAYGCTISGAGPTIVAVVESPEVGEDVIKAMKLAFKEKGGLEINRAAVSKLCKGGASTVDPQLKYEMCNSIDPCNL